MSADRWLTYADAASLLGVQVDSLRHRARREHWGKRMGNEGKALVLVPLDSIPPPGEPLGEPAGYAATPPAPPRPARRPDDREGDRVAAHLAHIAELERRVGELGAELAAARGERDRERGERHGERDRADRVTAELADLARQFATTTATAAAEGRARETALEVRLDAARAEMAALRDRPWWKRFAGLARGA